MILLDFCSSFNFFLLFHLLSRFVELSKQVSVIFFFDNYNIIPFCLSDVNESPVNLTLSSTSVDENSPLGTAVGIFSSNDLDGQDDKHIYSIMAPSGTPFMIGGRDNRTLLVNGSIDYETNPTVAVIIRATDKKGLFIQETFKIAVNGELICKMVWSDNCNAY